MARDSKINVTGGIGFCGLLTIVFIVLKLTGFINWSWLWVLVPLWIDIAILIVISIIGSIICYIIKKKWK